MYVRARLSVFLLILVFVLFETLVKLWNFELPQGQAICFPLALLAITPLSGRGRLLPGGVLVCASVLGAAAIGLNFAIVRPVAASFVVARLEGDPEEYSTSSFRNLINRVLKDTPEVRAGRYFSDTASHAEAQLLFSKSSPLLGVLWGSRHWLSISFPGAPEIKSLAELGGQVSYAGINSLRLVTKVPWIGLSLAPPLDSARFIGQLFIGLHRLSENDPNASLDLVDAGRIVGNWSTQAHRAYPWFMIGNYYLLEAVRTPGLGTGDLACALRAYKMSRRYLKLEDNSSLAAALINNRAVALYISGMIDRKRATVQRSRQLWLISQRLIHLKTLAGEPAVTGAEHNLAATSDHAFQLSHQSRLKKRAERDRIATSVPTKKSFYLNRPKS